MKTIERLKTKLAPVGVEVTWSEYAVYLDAPVGYVWKANGSNSLTIYYATNHQSWLCEAVKQEKDAINMGLRLATEDELPEIRHNNDDDTWGAAIGAPEKLAVNI